MTYVMPYLVKARYRISSSQLVIAERIADVFIVYSGGLTDSGALETGGQGLASL